MMHYTTLGKSGLKVSRIAFGCMSLQQRADAERLIPAALDGGINFFDTADLYERGANEEWLGQALKHTRQDVVVATKVGNQWQEGSDGWQWNPRPDYIRKAVEGSLKRLQRETIDLLQLHGGTIDDPVEELISLFDKLMSEGKIRAYGISSIRPNVIRRWTALSEMSTTMMQYSLLDRRPEEAAISLLEEKGVAVLARGALAQGLLSGKPPKPYLGHDTTTVATASSSVREASVNSRQPSQTAISFVLSQPAMAAAVVGIRTEAQLKEALEVFVTPPLSKIEVNRLQAAAPPLCYTDHR